MTLNDYLENLEGKSIAVVGYEVANAPLVKLLLDRGLDVTVCDKARKATLKTPPPCAMRAPTALGAHT